MSHKLLAVLVALIALIGLAPALAQIAAPPAAAPPVPPILRGMILAPKVGDPAALVTAPAGDKAVTLDVATDPERCRATISKLEGDRRGLRLELSDAQAKLADAMARLDAMTSKGGSAVMAYCDGRSTSRSTAGAVEYCDRFSCQPVSGVCNKVCHVSADCSEGRVCDAGEGVCYTSEEFRAAHPDRG